MKNIFFKNGIVIVIASLFFSSCYKSYDPASYAPPFTINGFTSSADVGKGNLIAYWSFDGNYMDSISSTVGTGVNTSFSAGFKGKALQGSSTGYVISSLPNALKSPGSFTIDYWMNCPQNTTGILAPVVISRTDQFWGAFDMFYENGSTSTTGNLKVHFNGQSEVWFTSANTTNPWGTWQNIALTYDAPSGVFTLYQGGQKVASQAAGGLGGWVFPATAGNIIFGTEQFQCTPSLGTAGSAQSWASYMTGMLDEVRIYNKALSPTELQSLMVLQGKGK